LNGAKGPKEVMDAFNLAQEAMGLFVYIEEEADPASEMEERRMSRLWCKAEQRLERRHNATLDELDAFNAFPTRQNLEQKSMGIRGIYVGPFEMDDVLSQKADFESKYHEDGSLVFGDLRIVRQDWGYNLVEIPY